jgi:hypothetical protein
LVTAEGAIITAPVSIPVIIVTIDTHMTVAGTVATAVSQAVISDEKEKTVLETNKKRTKMNFHIPHQNLSAGSLVVLF